MFITRLLSGIVLIIIALLSFHFGGFLLAAVLLLLSIGAFLELAKALGLRTEKNNPLVIFGLMATAIYYVLIAFNVPMIYVAMEAVISVILFLSIYVFAFPKYNVEATMSAVFAFLYAPVMLSFAYFTRGIENGKYIVWMILISSWGYDTCAYCVGMLFGKTIGNHKFLPKLSPKKSIEGVIGGVVGAGLIGFAYAKFIMPDYSLAFAAIAAVGGLIAQIGDLAASAIKRNKDIKDYGKCIPGHGGVMDRFDSVIFTAPITYLLAILWLAR